MSDTLTLQERLSILSQLGEYIGAMEGQLEFVIRQAKLNNGWFTVENTKKALQNIKEHFLNHQKMTDWAAQYNIVDAAAPRQVGLILAGNIPLVGFQDVMNVFAAGHIALIKPSDKDKYLIPHLLKVMTEINPKAAQYFKLVERLKGFDAVIATGSNNTSRYFETYFGKYPNIIRRNRNGIALISGKETAADFYALSEDIFTYFGLGCRNVAKIYIPKDYKLDPLLDALHERKDLVLHGKYKNNFDYNMAFNILNKTPFYNNGAIILIENESLQSRIAQLHYEYYQDENDLQQKIAQHIEDIQVLVGHSHFNGIPLGTPVVPFGSTQQPSLYDYADGIDTMAFLTNLDEFIATP